MKTERYIVNSPLVFVGAKKWMREECWRIYNKACKSRDVALRWVDPFCGGLSAPLFILPEDAWLNDSCQYLINFYNYITKHGNMPSFDHLDENGDGQSKDIYKVKRQRFNEKIKAGEIDDELAILFYYLNRAGYGGLNRYNKQGQFNTPYRGNICNAKTDFSIEQDVFKGWKFTSLNFMDVLDNAEEDDFLFIDPPYFNTFNSYTKDGFSYEQQVILAEKLATLPNPILATNSASEEMVKLYSDLGFSVHYRTRGNFIQRPKVKNGVHNDFKEAVFTKNIEFDICSEPDSE